MMNTLYAALFGLTALVVATSAKAETYNLRNTCAPWEYIPDNEALSSPAAALLTCENKATGSQWLALQILCFPKQDLLQMRYKTSYDAIPLPLTQSETGEPVQSDVYEVVSFQTSNGGFNHPGKQDASTGAWHFGINTIHYPLLRAISGGSFIDVALGPHFDIERLPLRKSSKALAGVINACRAVDGS